MKRCFAIFSVVLVASVWAQTSTVAGNWKGSLKIDRSVMTKVTKAEEKKALTAMLADLETTKVRLSLNANGTYTAKLDGSKIKQLAEGTYKVAGSKLTMVTTKRDGKAVPAKEQKPNVMTISADGKTLVRKGQEGPFMMTFTFTRG